MNPIHFTRKEPLSQESLGKTLSSILNQELLDGRTSQVPLSGGGSKRVRTWDYLFNVDKQPTVIEFDGNDHYMDALKIKRDQEKVEQAQEKGVRVVRWPFWVQLDSLTLKHYLGLEYPITTDFPHGFKGGTKYFPSCFCEKGVSRFLKELDSLPPELFDAVVESLQVMCDKHGREWVLSTTVQEKLKDLFP